MSHDTGSAEQVFMQMHQAGLTASRVPRRSDFFFGSQLAEMVSFCRKCVSIDADDDLYNICMYTGWYLVSAPFESQPHRHLSPLR